MKREGGIVTNLKDIQQVKALIAKGKAAGYLTVEEVSKSVPAEMSSPENFEEIIALFDQLDIAIVDSEKEGKSIAEIKDQVLGNRMDRIVTGGAHLPAELVDKYDEIGIFLAQGYGMTENGPSISAPDMSRPDKARTAGRVVLRCKTRVVDGELQVSSQVGEGTLFTLSFPAFDTEVDPE
jgi:acyl-CoA synthetase (AMP-forming)/AMP-acid ligase II